MVTGNFAMLIGVRPADINLWYLAVYADAFEWVELPNTHGMATFADGGVVGSKPYAAGGSYIDRMSDFCAHCHFDVKQKTGEKACPFNYLYWNFMIEHRERLKGNPRLSYVYRTLERMGDERIRSIRRDAQRFLDRLEPWANPATGAAA
jgi:deoxyribodipyrimidine photolyase-related protein